jgi:hypothetical protein
LILPNLDLATFSSRSVVTVLSAIGNGSLERTCDKISATALNPADWKIQKYGPFFIENYPAILGTDSAGVVEAVGEGVTAFKKGDKV